MSAPNRPHRKEQAAAACDLRDPRAEGTTALGWHAANRYLWCGSGLIDEDQQDGSGSKDLSSIPVACVLREATPLAILTSTFSYAASTSELHGAATHTYAQTQHTYTYKIKASPGAASIPPLPIKRLCLKKIMPGMMAHAFNPSPEEAEACRSPSSSLIKCDFKAAQGTAGGLVSKNSF